MKAIRVAGLLALVALGIAGSACVDANQTAGDRSQQRLLRPTATMTEGAMPPPNPPEMVGPTHDQMGKNKGKPF
jgi:hypothetical protein